MPREATSVNNGNVQLTKKQVNYAKYLPKSSQYSRITFYEELLVTYINHRLWVKGEKYNREKIIHATYPVESVSPTD